MVLPGGPTGDVQVTVQVTILFPGYTTDGLCSQYSLPPDGVTTELEEGLVIRPAFWLELLSMVNWNPASAATPFGLLLVTVRTYIVDGCMVAGIPVTVIEPSWVPVPREWQSVQRPSPGAPVFPLGGLSEWDISKVILTSITKTK